MREWSWRFAMKLLLLALASTSAEEPQLHFGKKEPKWQSVNDALPEQPEPFEPQPTEPVNTLAPVNDTGLELLNNTERRIVVDAKNRILLQQLFDAAKNTTFVKNLPGKAYRGMPLLEFGTVKGIRAANVRVLGDGPDELYYQAPTDFILGIWVERHEPGASKDTQPQIILFQTLATASVRAPGASVAFGFDDHRGAFEGEGVRFTPYCLNYKYGIWEGPTIMERPIEIISRDEQDVDVVDYDKDEV